MSKIKGVFECKECHGLAPIVKRYKGYEYRLCRHCNIKYVTHIVNGTVYVVDQYTPTRHRSFKKMDF